MARAFEDIIADLGGMGKFQWILLLLVNSTQLFTGWSMLMMSFAGVVPDYHCITEDWDNLMLSSSNTSTNMTTLNVCEVNGKACASFDFIGETHTVISEWDLVCDQKWAKQIITSVQMGGVLTGALLAGQITDTFGRKKALYGFNLLHIVMNVVAAFSVSWVMFAVLRFCIGVGIGAILVTVFSYPMEFLPIKWRPILTVLPTWACGVSLFSISALVLKDWSYLHLGCALLSLPSMLGAVFVPDSIRWMTLKGKTEDALKVFEQIARVNKTTVPGDVEKVLQAALDEELQQNEKAKQYTYLDLFRNKSLIKVDVVVWIFWFSLSMTFYGISFGVASLSGNIYLNIFLLAVMELPVRIPTFFFHNKIGRRWTTMGFFLLSAIPSLGCLLSQLFLEGDTRGTAINVLSLTAKMFIGSAWACAMIWTSESYPTVVRNLGYGWASMGARVGGILAPFLINFDQMPEASYIIMTVTLFFCTALCFTLDETKGKTLTDSLESGNKKSDKSSDADIDQQKGYINHGMVEINKNSKVDTT